MWGGDGPLPVVPGVQLVNQVSRTVTVCRRNRRQPVCLIIPLSDTMLDCMPVPVEEARVLTAKQPWVLGFTMVSKMVPGVTHGN